MKNKIDASDISKHLQEIPKILENEETPNSNADNTELAEMLHKSKVNANENIIEPPVCLEIITNNERSIIGTLGNFSCVIGKAKSKKTFLISIALAAAIKEDTVLKKFKVVLNSKQSKVILFDTEQSRYHVYKVVKRVCELAEIRNPDNFECYGLRAFNPQKRIELIDYAINKNEEIGLIIIDGIRDLVNDINSPSEATQIVTQLMKWSEEKNIHIVTVIHQNKGDSNARGHLGTELINKAETVISVTKDTKESDISIVEAEYCREKDFPAFAFKIDVNGLPYVLHDWQPQKETKKSVSPFNYPKETHARILTEIFKRTPNPRYKELWTEVKYFSQEYGIPFGDTKAKEFVTYYINQTMVTTKKTENERYPAYSLTL